MLPLIAAGVTIPLMLLCLHILYELFSMCLGTVHSSDEFASVRVNPRWHSRVTVRIETTPNGQTPPGRTTSFVPRANGGDAAEVACDGTTPPLLCHNKHSTTKKKPIMCVVECLGLTEMIVPIQGDRHHGIGIFSVGSL